MRRNRALYAGIAVFILGDIVLGAGLQMTGIVTPLVGWAIIVIGTLVAGVLFVIAWRSKPDDSDKTERVIAYRQQDIEKRKIPDKLMELDMYLLQKIESQDITLEQLKKISKQCFRWYYWPGLLLFGLTYSIPVTRRLFNGTYRNFILRFALRWNLALRMIGLGTLPTMEENEEYKAMYRDLIALESGLPNKIVARIHRNVRLCPNLISLRILRPDNQFWDEIPENSNHPFIKLLNITQNSLGILALPVDGVLTGLRSEVSADIEAYFAKGE